MMNNKINEIKNSLEGINSRITQAEEWISDLEDKIVEITAAEQTKEKRMKRNEDSIRDLWDNIKRDRKSVVQGKSVDLGGRRIIKKKEFRIMIVKMIQNLGNRMEKIQETFHKDLEELKSKQNDEQQNK